MGIGKGISLVENWYEKTIFKTITDSYIKKNL
jgi:hypothetical protein